MCVANRTGEFVVEGRSANDAGAVAEPEHFADVFGLPLVFLAEKQR